ncbi:MAG TPA: S-layer homology domain-containing protein [Candidatus Scatomorpha stercoravium]|nr:S-layer homology domain-containing protein [Candidatus Scatomorpha stercoravium]
MKTGRASTVGWLLAILSFALTALLPMTGITRELQLFFAATVFVIVIMAFELLPVLVSAVFVPATFPFVDVKTGDWFYDYVAYVYSNGLMDGTSATTFEPNANMTRAMVWAILARIDGETVTGEDWIETAREWTMANGVSDGTDADGYVTREQLATMLWRYAGEPDSDYSLSAFTDAGSVSGYAAAAMAWAVEHGIISGVTDTTLAPQGTATRAQCAAMLMRFVEP